MKTEKMHDRAQLFGKEFLHNYARSRRAGAWFFAALFLLFLAAAQFLTYFLAQRAGHSSVNAGILAAVPFIGPAALCVQTAMAGGAFLSPAFFRPLILLGALLPSVLFLFLGAHFHDLRVRALCVLAEREEAAAMLAEKQAARQRIAAAPASVIVRPGAAKAAPTSLKTPVSSFPEPVSESQPEETVPFTPKKAEETPASSTEKGCGSPSAVSGQREAEPPVVPAIKAPPLPAATAAVRTERAAEKESKTAAGAAARGAVPLRAPERAAVSAETTSAVAGSEASALSGAEGMRRTEKARDTIPDTDKKTPPVSPSLQKAEEEYTRAMQDVLAFLNKK